MDHRFLNYEVPPFDRIVPTAENLAAEIWNRLEPHFAGNRARLHNVRLFETEEFVRGLWRGSPWVWRWKMTRVTRRYKFAASHRLHSVRFSEEENRELYGKCNNPYGHGHDYVLDVSVTGPVDAASGQVVNLQVLDRWLASTSCMISITNT